jgi:hypothetical protein
MTNTERASVTARRRPAVVAAIVLSAMSLLVASCGSERFTYAGSSQYKFFFRVPGTWETYTNSDIAKAIGTDSLSQFNRVFPFIQGYDGAPESSLLHVLDIHKLLDHPAAFAWVRNVKLSVDPNTHESIGSFTSIKNGLFQLQPEAAGQPAIFTLLSDKEYTIPGGYRVDRTSFALFESNGDFPALEGSQVGAFDPGTNYMYFLVVWCSPKCFTQNKGTIDQVINSWSIKG